MYAEATKYIYSLMARLSKISRRMMSRADSMDICSNDMALFAIPFALKNSESEAPLRIRMTDLSRMMMISKPAATHMVNQMVRHGYVERARDEADRRVIYIQATPEGQQVFRQNLEDRLHYEEQAIRRVGMEHAAQLGELLNEFVDALVCVTENEDTQAAATEVE